MVKLYWKNRIVKPSTKKPNMDKFREFHQLERFLSTCDNTGVREKVINRMEDLVKAI